MRVKTELIRDAESDNVVSFKVQRRTSGLNRKLSVLTNFEAISNNLRVETGITRHAESNDDVSFRVQTRNTGLKKRRLVQFRPSNYYLLVQNPLKSITSGFNRKCVGVCQS